MRASLVAALALVGATTACGSGPATSPAAQSGAGPVAADCQMAVRYEGVTYTEVDYVEKAGHRVGQATLGECHDVGSDAVGITFPSDAKTAEAWSIDDFSQSDVIATPSHGS